MHLPPICTANQRRRCFLSSVLAINLLINLLVIWPESVIEAAPTHHHKRRSYSLKKGSRLERHHRKSLHDWRRAYLQPSDKQRHHRKRAKIHRIDLDEILRQMDSVVKPRFGRR